MQVRSIFRGARISAFKCREVTREIQGKPVSAALDLLAFTPKKAARLVEKTLKSAVANAENNNNLRVERLVVQEAVVGEGPTIKRFQPKARGSAGPIRKRTSHIRIILTDEVVIPERTKSTGKARKKTDRRTLGRRNKASSAATSGSTGSSAAASSEPEAKAPEVIETDAPTTTDASDATSTSPSKE